MANVKPADSEWNLSLFRNKWWTPELGWIPRWLSSLYDVLNSAKDPSRITLRTDLPNLVIDQKIVFFSFNSPPIQMYVPPLGSWELGGFNELITSRFGRHLENQMLRFPAQILPMMGFSSCDNSDVFQWPKLVSIGGSCSEPFSHLHWFSS